MNQTQRKFLIDKINETIKEQDAALKKSLPDKPDLSASLLQELFSERVVLRNTEELNKILLDRALKNPSSWLSNGSAWSSAKEVTFKLSEIFVIPSSYEEAFSAWKEKTLEIETVRKTLRTNAEGLCTRIQLASPKVLEKLISEINDMGDITLMDVTLKSLVLESSNNKFIE